MIFAHHSAVLSDSPRMYPYLPPRFIGSATPARPGLAHAFAQLVPYTHISHTKFTCALALHIRYPDLLRYPAYLSSRNPPRVERGCPWTVRTYCSPV